MPRTNTIVNCGTYLLIALALVFSAVAAAESEKDFAKCQRKLGKNASWLTQNANKAKHSYDRKVQALVARHVSGRQDLEREEVRINAVIERLVGRYEQSEYRRVLIDEAADKVLNVKSGADFRCSREANIRLGFKRNLDRYKRSLEEVEEAIRERLDIEHLGPKEGLAVILFYSSGYAQNVIIDRLHVIGGGLSFGPVEDGVYFRVVKAKAGDYRWHSVSNRYWNGRLTAHLKHSKYDFRVEAGKLNYTGAFTYKSEVFNRFSTNVVDRTSVVLSLLESRYPELLNQLEISNGLNSDNRFVEFYMNEKRAVQHGDDSA